MKVFSFLPVLWLLWPASVLCGALQYTVTTDARLDELTVRACFEGDMPRRLIARAKRAPELLREVRLESSGEVIALTNHGTSLTLPISEAPACVHYRVDINGPGVPHRHSGHWRTREAVVFDPALWLWLPDKKNVEARLDFVLPPGFDVSAPWPRLGRSGDTVSYTYRERLPGWEARLAIGRFAVESLELPGGRIRYALLPGEPAADAEAVRRWVTGGARALASAYGRLPVPDVQLLVVPVGHGKDPVPWGEVQRGGGDAVHLYINQRRPPEEFRDDWVLVHEFSHLLHPVLQSSDRWLSEGLASYYQNVLRARAGLMSKAQAWERLHAGFERGIRGTPPGRSLEETSETMTRDHTYMRVYWSGAAIALLADVGLRRRTRGAQSLDTALAALGACCLPATRRWTAEELLQRLDDLTGTTVFMELYEEHIDSADFPELSALYTELGLQATSPTTLDLDPAVPGVALRTAIMKGVKQ
jgi:hypothetical protein